MIAASVVLVFAVALFFATLDVKPRRRLGGLNDRIDDFRAVRAAGATPLPGGGGR